MSDELDLTTHKSPPDAQPLPTDFAVSVHGIGKMYPLYTQPRDRLKQSLWYGLPSFLRHEDRVFHQEFWALRNISFQVKPGETFGIIGQNGSGKSTLLQMLAGTLLPTEGKIILQGQTAALLELGSGFNPDFTGRENIYLSGAIMGLQTHEIEAKLAEIIAFADIGDFIDQPVKLYSSGMYVRLAFAVQTSIEPDILVVDEVLSVGDIFFQQKCFNRLSQLLAKGTAVVMVSHDMGIIETVCDQVLLLHKGAAQFLGQPNEAVQQYYLFERGHGRQPHSNQHTPSSPAAPPAPPSSIDWPEDNAFLDFSQASLLGEGGAQFTAVALCDARGQPCYVFEIGQIAHFYFEIELLQDIEVPVAGVTLTNWLNVNVHGKNSAQMLLSAPLSQKKGSRLRFKQTIQLDIAAGSYTFSIGCSTLPATIYANMKSMPYAQFHENEQVLQIVQQAGSFQVIRPRQGLDLPFHGLVNLTGEVQIEGEQAK